MSFNEDAYVGDKEPAEQEYTRDEAHDPDVIGDSEGTTARKEAAAPVRGAAPNYILDEFTWNESVDRATGEVKYFMNPKPHIITEAAASAPMRLHSAYLLLSDEDKAVGDQIAKDALNYIQTLEAVNGYLPKSVTRGLADQAADGAVRVARWLKRAESWAGSLKDGADEPDGLQNLIAMLDSAGRVAAMMYYAYLQVEPTGSLNFKGAAWKVLRYEAQKTGDRYLNPGEVKGKGENTKSATRSLLARY